MPRTEILDGGAAGGHGSKIVDNHETARRDPRVQVLKGKPGGFIHIAVEPQDGNGVERGCGNRVAEPTRNKACSGIEQVVAAKVLLHLFKADAEILAKFPKRVAFISGKGRRVGFRQTLKRIEQPHRAMRIAGRSENAAHEDAAATAPNAGFDEVSADLFAQDGEAAACEVIQTLLSHQCFCFGWPVAAILAQRSIEGQGTQGIFIAFVAAIRDEIAAQAAFQKIEVKRNRRMVGRMWRISAKWLLSQRVLAQKHYLASVTEVSRVARRHLRARGFCPPRHVVEKENFGYAAT